MLNSENIESNFSFRSFLISGNKVLFEILSEFFLKFATF